MTTQTPASGDPRDPFEDRLAVRMRRLAEGGVRPIDASAIAHAAAAEGGRSRLAAGLAGRLGKAGAAARVAWLLAGAALVGVVALGGAAVAGGHLPALFGGPGGQAGSGPTASPTPGAAGSVAECGVGNLVATVVNWTGAAGSRIADVTVHNRGSSACSIAINDRPQLIDGHQAVLIQGPVPRGNGRITLAPGGSATTEVADSNYCGPDPVAPVSVAFVLSSGDRLAAKPASSSDLSGVPPCNGPSEPGLVTMQPWAP